MVRMVYNHNVQDYTVVNANTIVSHLFMRNNVDLFVHDFEGFEHKFCVSPMKTTPRDLFTWLTSKTHQTFSFSKHALYSMQTQTILFHLDTPIHVQNISDIGDKCIHLYIIAYQKDMQTGQIEFVI